MNQPTANEIETFLLESNAIEGEYSDSALEDAQDAWKYAISLELLNVGDFLRIHQLLMKRLRPDIAGKYRTCDVWIGGNKRKYFGQEVLESQLSEVAGMIMNSFRLEDSDRIDACKNTHVLFETVHPFEDGNGRTGRIIYNWHRLKLGLPLHIIHEGEEQQEYYKWFK